MIQPLSRATRHFLFWSLVLLAISLTVVRVSLLGVEAYRAQLAGVISEQVGLPVKIGHLSAKMRGFDPELLVSDITFGAFADKPVIALQEIRIGIHVADIVMQRDWLSSTWVTLVGSQLTIIRKADGRIAIAGLKASEGDPLWLLQGSKYELLNSQITWQDERHLAKPLLFNQVDLAIHNAGERHRVNVLMPLTQPLGHSLAISMDLDGNFFKPAGVKGNIFIDGQQINLPQWLVGYPPSDFSLQSGILSLQARVKIEHSQAVAMSGQFDLHALKVNNKIVGTVPVDALKSRFNWTHDNLWRRLDLFGLQWSNHSQHYQSNFSVGIQNDDQGGWQALALAVDQLDLQVASKLAVFFPHLPVAYQQRLKQAQLSGYLLNTQLFADFKTQAFAVNARFNHLAFNAFADVPGFSGLTGQIKGSDKNGSIFLSLQDKTLNIPAWFNQVLPVSRLVGRINWQKNQQAWQIASDRFIVDLPGFISQSRFKLNLPRSGEVPFLNLSLAFISDDVGKLSAYLPVKVMKPQDYDWFKVAFPAGRIKKGRLSFNSRLDKFPESPEDGRFLVAMDVEHLQLNYAPEWPLIDEIKGSAHIVNKVLTCQADAATSLHLKLGKAVVINPNLGVSKTISIKGDLEGQIADVFSFLQATELKASTEKFIHVLKPSGSTHITADLLIPLGGIGEHKVAVNAQLADAGFNVMPLDLPISQIKGELKFTESGIFSEPIAVKIFNQSARLKFNSTPESLLIDVKGSAGIDALQQQFNIPGLDLADGEMGYQLQVNLPQDSVRVSADKPITISVNSNLQGVALDLPDTLAKTRQQKQPLSLEFLLKETSELPIRIKYGEQLQAVFKWLIPQQKVESAHLVVGKGEALLPKLPGLWLDIHQDRLVLDNWLKPATQSVGAMKSGLPITPSLLGQIRHISVQTQDLQWQGNALGYFNLELQPHQRHWSASFDSALGSGIAIVPNNLKGNDKISLDLAELNLTAVKQFKTVSTPNLLTASSDTSGQFAQWPLLSVNSSKTLWQGVDMGSLSIETERLDNGVAFKKIDLMGIALQLSSTGRWTVENGQASTQWQGHLQTPKLGRLLTDLEITHELAETIGGADFSLHWPAPIYDFSFKNLSGQLDMHLKEGRILSVEPGFGRILGILAFEQWAKRLQLDFSDIYQQGLTFDAIDGHFKLVDGKAHTDNLQVNAVPASITLIGDTDFVRHIMDYNVAIVPKSADALPIAGTIVGKIGTLVALGLTGAQHEGLFFGSQYQIKGKWDNLLVIPHHENDGLFQKTWSGITTFPWLGKSNNTSSKH